MPKNPVMQFHTSHNLSYFGFELWDAASFDSERNIVLFRGLLCIIVFTELLCKGSAKALLTSVMECFPILAVSSF